jgi:hypothetical protein
MHLEVRYRCVGGRRPVLGAVTEVAAEADGSSGGSGRRGVETTATSVEGHMGTMAS